MKCQLCTYWDCMHCVSRSQCSCECNDREPANNPPASAKFFGIDLGHAEEPAVMVTFYPGKVPEFKTFPFFSETQVKYFQKFIHEKLGEISAKTGIICGKRI